MFIGHKNDKKLLVKYLINLRNVKHQILMIFLIPIKQLEKEEPEMPQR